MSKFQFTARVEGGRWLINGRRYHQLSSEEKIAVNEFIQESKSMASSGKNVYGFRGLSVVEYRKPKSKLNTKRF